MSSIATSLIYQSWIHKGVCRIQSINFLLFLLYLYWMQRIGNFQTGNTIGCQWLLEAGAEVNFADKDGLTPLHCSASRGHYDCVCKLLNSFEAQVDPMDKNGCTPLFYACALGHDNCASVLLSRGACSQHTDTKGRT